MIVLALIAPLVAGRRLLTPYWVGLSLSALLLTSQGPSPLHSLLYRLPGFAGLHPHQPERIMMIFYLSTALLAGATLSCLRARGREVTLLAVLPAMLLVPLLTVRTYVPLLTVATMTLVAMMAILAFLVAYPLLPRHRELLTAAIVLVATTDLLVAGWRLIEDDLVLPGPRGIRKVDIGKYYSPGGAGRFLMSRRASPSGSTDIIPHRTGTTSATCRTGTDTMIHARPRSS